MKFAATLQRMRLNKRILAVLCLLLVLVQLFPLIAISFYAYPTHDDFPNALELAEVWARTGSFGELLRTVWEGTVYDYYHWQGTFVAMFSSRFQPMAISLDLFWIMPVVMLVLLALSAAYMSKQLVMRLLKADFCAFSVFYAVLMTFLIQYLPGIREMVYWVSANQYILTPIVLMVFIGLMVRLHLSCGKPAFLWRSACAVVSAFLIGGLPYPLALGCLLGFAFAAIWLKMIRSRASLPAVLSFAAGAAALIIVVIAPGNAVRQNRVGDAMNPIAAVIYSVVEALETAGGWFGPQLLGAALLLMPVLWKPLKESSLKFRWPVLFSVLSFGVFAASFVPPIYATGRDGYLYDRILGSLYMLYALLVLLNLLYWTGWLAKSGLLDNAVRPHEKGGISLWRLGVCALALLWGLFATGAVLATPTLGAARSLLLGEAQQYRQELAVREEKLREAASLAEAQEAIEELSIQPIVLPLDKLIYQKETTLPYTMHRTFRLQELCGIYGAGQIPQEVWDTLKPWE